MPAYSTSSHFDHATDGQSVMKLSIVISLSQPLWRSPSKSPLRGWTLLAYVKLHQILVGIWYWFFGEHKSAATLGEKRESDYASRLLCRHFDSPCCPKSWNAERFDMSLPTFGIGPCWSCFREEYAGVCSAGNLQSLERQKSAIHNCRPAGYNTTVTTTPQYSQQPAIKYSTMVSAGIHGTTPAQKATDFSFLYTINQKKIHKILRFSERPFCKSRKRRYYCHSGKSIEQGLLPTMIPPNCKNHKVSLTELFSKQGNRPSSFPYELLHCLPRAMAEEVKGISIRRGCYISISSIRVQNRGDS